MIGLGSNLESPELGSSPQILSWALDRLERFFGPLEVSPLFRSAPISPIPQPDFFNAVACARSPDGLRPEDCLARLMEIERRAGRHREPRRDGRPAGSLGPRVLDLDLLLFGRERRDRPDLVVPHPRLRERRFVIEPLFRLRPDLRLEPDGATVTEVRDRLGTAQRLEPVPWT